MSTKVKFEFYNTLLERNEVETIYAKLVDEKQMYYQLENIPFFVQGFSFGDIVKVEQCDDFLKVLHLVKESGNGTLNIIFLDPKNEIYKKGILGNIEELGCGYEGIENVVKGYYTVNIPENKNYENLISLLEKEKNNIDFREAWLG